MGAKEQADGRAQQEAIRRFARSLPGALFKDRTEFERVLDDCAKKAGLNLRAPAPKAVNFAFSDRDKTVTFCPGQDSHTDPDPKMRDIESVPLSETLDTFFAREVKPHVPDAWIDTTKRDPKDGEVGLVGYEINFNRYFYRYTPPRTLEEIEADIRAIEAEIVRMLAEVTGGSAAG